MNREIRRIDGTVLIPVGEYDTDVLAVEKHKFNLANANLSDANLILSNLSGANLAGAYLVGANLVGANLANTNLAGAYLVGANLANTNLAGANLTGANLIRSNLTDARYSTNELLQSYWSLPPKHPLILELMAHDAEYCGIAKMDEWAKGGDCPFKDSVREYFFPEDREMWLSANTEDKVPKLRGKKLLEALCEATNVRI